MQIPPAVITALHWLRVLSSRRLSVAILLFLSAGLFLTVLFIALPSARIRIWPSLSIVSHTANVVLVASGVTLDVTTKNTLPLTTIHMNIDRSLTFDEVSKKFMGQNAKVEMTLINETKEVYSLRAGTRLVNQAGMIFRTLESADIPPATALEPGTLRLQAEAQSTDLYGEMIGERGNIPGGLKWEVPGLTLEERKLVYARNAEAAIGGTSVYGNELQEKDLQLAKKQLEQELLRTAKVRTEEEVENLRARTDDQYTILQYDVLTAMSFSDFQLPEEMLGEEVKTVPVSGKFSYTTLAYNKSALLDLLLPGLLDHIEEGQELIEQSVMLDGISVHVIEYDDNLGWVKITAELSGKQRAVLSPKTQTGRAFDERLRTAIAKKTVQEARRIIQNFPEVERVEVSVWPPWRASLPALSSNIVVLPQ